MNWKCGRNVLERYYKHQEVDRNLSAIPRPNNEKLRRISIERNQDNREADEYSTEKFPHFHTPASPVVVFSSFFSFFFCALSLTEEFNEDAPGETWTVSIYNGDVLGLSGSTFYFRRSKVFQWCRGQTTLFYPRKSQNWQSWYIRWH